MNGTSEYHQRRLAEHNHHHSRALAIHPNSNRIAKPTSKRPSPPQRPSTKVFANPMEFSRVVQQLTGLTPPPPPCTVITTNNNNNNASQTRPPRAPQQSRLRMRAPTPLSTTAVHNSSLHPPLPSPLRHFFSPTSFSPGILLPSPGTLPSIPLSPLPSGPRSWSPHTLPPTLPSPPTPFSPSLIGLGPSPLFSPSLFSSPRPLPMVDWAAPGWLPDFAFRESPTFGTNNFH